MRWAATIAWAAALAGCSGSRLPMDPGVVCTAIAVSSLNVTVSDAATGLFLCDASVIAIHRGEAYTLRPTGACTYAGPYERAGEFEVIATRPGYEEARVRGIRVTADECHVIPVAVTVNLRRN